MKLGFYGLYPISYFISWFICFGRWCIDELGVFRANQTSIYVSWSTSKLRVRLAPWNRFKSSSKIFLLTVPRRLLPLWIICVLCFLCFRVCSLLPCCHLLGKGWPLGSCRDVYCVFVTFPCGILNQVWYLIVSFPDLCRLSYFNTSLIKCAWVLFYNVHACNNWKFTFHQNVSWIFSYVTLFPSCFSLTINTWSMTASSDNMVLHVPIK